MLIKFDGIHQVFSIYWSLWMDFGRLFFSVKFIFEIPVVIVSKMKGTSEQIGLNLIFNSINCKAIWIKKQKFGTNDIYSSWLHLFFINLFSNSEICITINRNLSRYRDITEILATFSTENCHHLYQFCSLKLSNWEAANCLNYMQIGKFCFKKNKVDTFLEQNPLYQINLKTDFRLIFKQLNSKTQK
jgi:hypothetical protein